MRTLSILFFMLVSTCMVFAQGAGRPLATDLADRAKAEEGNGRHEQAGKTFMQAGHAFVRDADSARSRGMDDASIHASLLLAAECFNRAASNFETAGKTTDKSRAEAEAAKVRARIAGGGTGEAVRVADIVKENEVVQADASGGTPVTLVAKSATVVFTPPAMMKHKGVEEVKGYGTRQTGLYVESKAQDAVFGLTEEVLTSEQEEQLRRGGTDSLCEKTGAADGSPAANLSKEQIETLEKSGLTLTPEMRAALGLHIADERRVIDIGSEQACMMLHEYKEAGKPGRVDFHLYFVHNGSFYRFSGQAPLSWKDAVEKSLESFMIEK